MKFSDLSERDQWLYQYLENESASPARIRKHLNLSKQQVEELAQDPDNTIPAKLYTRVLHTYEQGQGFLAIADVLQMKLPMTRKYMDHFAIGAGRLMEGATIDAGHFLKRWIIRMDDYNRGRYASCMELAESTRICTKLNIRNWWKEFQKQYQTVDERISALETSVRNVNAVDELRVAHWRGIDRNLSIDKIAEKINRAPDFVRSIIEKELFKAS